MMAQFIDYPSVVQQDIATEDTADASQEARDAWVIPLVIPEEDVSTLLAQYDPSSASSPNAANSRILARLIMDALVKATS